MFDANNLPALIKAPISINESMVFRGSVVRRLAQVFRDSSGKLTDIVARIVRLSGGVLRITSLYLLLGFIATFVDNGESSLLDVGWLAPLTWLPSFDLQVWALIFIAIFYLDRVLVRLARSCSEVQS